MLFLILFTNFVLEDLGFIPNHITHTVLPIAMLKHLVSTPFAKVLIGVNQHYCDIF